MESNLVYEATVEETFRIWGVHKFGTIEYNMLIKCFLFTPKQYSILHFEMITTSTNNIRN